MYRTGGWGIDWALDWVRVYKVYRLIGFIYRYIGSI